MSIETAATSSKWESSGVDHCVESTALLSSEISTETELHYSDNASVHSDDSDNERPLIASGDSKIRSKDSLFPNEIQQQISEGALLIIDNLYWFSRNYCR